MNKISLNKKSKLKIMMTKNKPNKILRMILRMNQMIK